MEADENNVSSAEDSQQNKDSSSLDSLSDEPDIKENRNDKSEPEKPGTVELCNDEMVSGKLDTKDKCNMISKLNVCEEIDSQSESAVASEGPSYLTDSDMILAEENERLATISLSGSESQDVEEGPKVMDREVQYKKLIELLTKSQFYTDFLIKKIEVHHNSPKKRARRENKDKTGSQGHAAYNNTKSRKRNAEQMMDIAADVISNKKLRAENPSLDQVEDDNVGESSSKKFGNDEDIASTKTLPNGLTVPKDQPELLIGASLRDYQMEGLNWLKVLYENGVNGILADEMGLGKTIQIIALIAHLVEKKVRGPFLIIGPLSTLPNWLLEFERFSPDIPVVLYHGNAEARAEVQPKIRQKRVVNGHKMYPVVMTSFEYPLRDAKILSKHKWSYIIIDEGHRIKNHNSQLSKALRTYNSANRLLLTGTPLHNNLSELWALLNFLLPEIFDNLEVFESLFNVIDLEGEEGNQRVLDEERKKNILSTMHKILSPFMLRRVKSEVNLNLPPKKELIVYAPMTPIQLDLYKAVLDYNIKRLTNNTEKDDLVKEGAKRGCASMPKRYVFKDLQFDKNGDVAEFEVNDDKKTLVVKDPENKGYAIRVQMRNTGIIMRKIVNHPYLVQYPLESDSEYCRIDEDIVKTSGKLLVLDAMLHKLKSRGHKVLLFSTFTSLIDILEDYLSLRDFKYVRIDGRTPLPDRQVFIRDFNNDPEIFLFLISTRAGGLGINLASADTVILYDSDWNPQVDLQAQDRCHRIGQTRPVVVYRFVTAGTVDEKIVVRSAAKRKLEKMIIKKGSFNSITKPGSDGVDLDDLEKLLNSRDHHGVIHPNGFVFSDSELDELLDRSDMLKGLAPVTVSENIEARQFKEYYGYTGVLGAEKRPEIRQNAAEIVDNNSNDTACPSVLQRRPSPRKRRSVC